jgi:hypothetical protein
MSSSMDTAKQYCSVGIGIRSAGATAPLYHRHVAHLLLSIKCIVQRVIYFITYKHEVLVTETIRGVIATDLVSTTI